jgi:CRP/FNR family transcriptional regulator, anaerobic regulatory protein
MESTVVEKITDFFNSYPLQKHKKGQVLIHAGDNPMHVLQLVSGKVKQYDLSYRGDEVVLNVFKPPAFFPMSYAMNKTPNKYFFEADSDLELRKAPTEEVVTFVRANNDVLYDLLGRVYRGADGLLERMAHLMAGTAKTRVLFELIVECRRFGEEGPSGWAVALSESDIGARAGLSRETVSREISKLRADGIISINNRQISVPDLVRLEDSLGDDL